MKKKETPPALPKVCSVIDSSFQEKYRIQAFTLALGYAYGQVSYQQLNKLLASHGVKPRQFAQPIVDDGYFMRNCKTYLLAHAAGRQPGIEEYELSETTQKLLMRCYRTVHLRGKLKQLSTRYRVLDLQQLDRMVSLVLSNQNFNTYLDKFINRKLIFLARHFGLSQEDIKSDLIIACTRGLLKAYPTFNDATHVLNTAKQTAHNRGMNLITEHTSQGRNRFCTEGDRNAYRHFSVEALRDASADAFESDIDVSHSANAAFMMELSIHQTDLRTSLNTIAAKLTNAPGKRLFLDILRGQHDEGFSTFLGTPNDEFADTEPFDVLLDNACTYVGVDKDKGMEFLQSLKKVL